MFWDYGRMKYELWISIILKISYLIRVRQSPIVLMKNDKSKPARDGQLMQKLSIEMKEIMKEKGIIINIVQAKELIAQKIYSKGGLSKEL